MPTLVSSAISGVVGTISTLFSAMTAVSSTDSTGIGQYFAVGIACSLALFGIKLVKRVVWGA